MRFKRTLAISFASLITIIILASCKDSAIKIDAVNGQSSLTRRGNEFAVKEIDTKSYASTDEMLTIEFESLNMNGKENKLFVNDHVISLGDIVDEKNVFNKHTFNILGANVKDGKLNLSIEAGKDSNNKHDKFQIRNLKLKIDKDEIWSNEFSKEDYLNISQNFGPNDLKSDYRFGYQAKRSYSFNIPSKYINCQAIITNENFEKFTVDDEETKVIDNYSYIKCEANIKDNETITDSKALEIETSNNIKSLIVTMDGLEVNRNINFASNAWAPGNHEIKIYALNEYGFIKQEVIHFTLSNYSNSTSNIKYKMYNPGMTQKLSDTINLGKEVEGSEYEVGFTKIPNLNFVVDANDKTDFVWEGVVPLNRTAFMQVYNQKLKKYETISTAVANSNDSNIKLGYKILDKESYLNKGQIYFRVGNININKNKEIVANIYHTTDVQYMTQKGILDSLIGDEAHEALNDMADYLIENKDNSYSVMTGDFVQTKKDREKEWEIFMKNFMNPLLENKVKLGVVSGNHDVGGLRENSPHGSHALDDELYYDMFSRYLGEDKFKDLDYYGGSFMNNRSHYDVINLGGHNFIFLYLGWGSSVKGVHVSNIDIEYAKTVLEKYSNTDVILCVHEYLDGLNHRTPTANYLYKHLIEKYSNIKMVMCGHINGTSRLTSSIDDNNDGITDREVHELLFDLQEEDDLYGASYIRALGLDFKNNQFVVSTYSPWFNDTEIEVIENPEVVKHNLNFTLDFDLNNVGYGMKSYGFR